MSIILFLLFMTYLVPVVPVARRIAWDKQEEFRKKNTKTLPAREVVKAYPGSDYLYVNGSITKPERICENCGGSGNYHPDGIHSTLFWYHSGVGDTEHRVCRDFKTWRGKRKSWDEVTFMDKEVPSMVRPALFSALFYPAYWTGSLYKHVEPDWNTFAKPPAAVAQEIRIKKLELDNDRLERELKVGPYREEAS